MTDLSLVKKDHRIRSMHPNYINANASVDFSDLWYGAVDRGSGRSRMAGFSARPKLAEELFAVVKSAMAYTKPVVLRGAISELRSFWRFLDAYEALQAGETSEGRIDSVSQITILHGERWLTPTANAGWKAVRPECYRRINAWIQVARHSKGLKPLFWPPAPNPDRIKRDDVPTEREGKRLISLLTLRAHAIWKRWARADELAECGRSLLDLTRSELRKLKASNGTTEADAHATYRDLIRRTGNPMPDARAVNAFFGDSQKQLPTWWPVHRTGSRTGQRIGIEKDLLPGLYPSGEDLYSLVSLFMALSGWNPTTAFALDCRTESSWSGQYAPGMVWLHSYKARGDSWQDTVSPENHSAHCYQIVVRLLERTRPLRAIVATTPDRCDLPDIAAFSPWLAASDSKNVQVLESHSLNQIRAFLDSVVADNNRGSGPKHIRLPAFTPSDLRDVFASAVHRSGNYSLLLTQMALGHKRSGTTRRYLRSIAWRQESEHKLNEMLVGLIDQIVVHRRIDLTLLRATMDGINITQEQVDRLEEYRRNRTYSGMGCSDPFNPPDWIDPGNPRDGISPCIQGHRCPSCPKGRVFNDSISFLARYAVELQIKRQQCGDVKWYGSSDEMDLEVYMATLRQWPDEVVEKEMKRWRDHSESNANRIAILSGGRH